MKIYLVIELYKNGDAPRILGAFRKKGDADRTAYDPRALAWRNVVPVRLF